MFVVKIKSSTGLVSQRRYLDKKLALGVMFGLRSANQQAWLEYEPTDEEIREAHDRALLADFVRWVSEKELSQYVAERDSVIGEFMKERY